VARTGASTGENIYLADVPIAVFASYLVRVQFANRGVARVVGQFMRTEEYFDYIEGSIGGSAQPNAGAPVLTGARLACPPVGIAEAFYSNVESFDLRRLRNMTESGTLAALRDTLLPRIMSRRTAYPRRRETCGRPCLTGEGPSPNSNSPPSPA
jgi:hypothetical protein